MSGRGKVATTVLGDKELAEGKLRAWKACLKTTVHLYSSKLLGKSVPSSSDSVAEDVPLAP